MSIVLQTKGTAPAFVIIDELDSCSFQFLSIGDIYLADLN